MKHTAAYFLILWSILMAMCACTSPMPENLIVAEQVMEEHPDSALSLIEALSPDDIRGNAPRAKYALLLTQAQTKNYIPIPSDSLINVALDYYDDGSTSTDLMKTLFYKGSIMYDHSDLSSSIRYATRAHDLAVHFDDDYWRAKSAELMTFILLDSYLYKETEIYAIEACEYYKRVGKIANNRFSLCDLSVLYSRQEKYNRAITILDSVYTVTNNSEQPDTMIMGYCTNALMATYLSSHQYEKADSMRNVIINFGEISNPLNFLVNSAKTLLRLGKPDEAYAFISQANSLANGDFDYASIYTFLVDYYKEKGQYKEAQIYTDSILNFQNRAAKQLIEQSAMTSMRDYYNSMAVEESQKSSRLTNILIACSIVFIIAVIVFIIIYRLRIRLKNAELDSKISDIIILSSTVEKQRQDIRLLSDKISDKSAQEMNDIIEKLFRNKWEMLNHMCNEYFEKRDNDATRGTIINAIESEIDNLRSPKNLKEIEDAVNRYMDGIASNLRTQCPFLKEEDYTFVSLIFAGLSPRAICLLFEINLKRYYNKRQYIIEKIRSSSAPSKSLFLSRFK